MRIPILTILALGAAALAQPGRAQTYDPSYPVCLHVYGPVSYFDCRYTSMGQCQLTASGRAAQCLANPYMANAYIDPSPRRHRRYRHGY